MTLSVGTASLLASDYGKLRWSLVPWDSVRAILNILEAGAKKYAPQI
jgi:hypothetical protein